VTQLAQDGITLKDLSYLMITHFHPDHIGALPEFAAVPWIYRCDTLQQLVSLSLLRGLRKGFIRPLVPTVPKGSLPISKQHFTDTWNGDASLDLFGDGSFHLIDLPGHTEGQMGVATQGYFFTADAQWEADASPHPLGVFLQEDRRAYRKTLAWLQTLPSSIQQFPTHTMEAYA
jgi:glyoxylase-like metal-dependent hydrolase (beta-lactamase superfamily II)